MSSTGKSITASDLGPWINIVTWILMVVMCLATFVKLFSKWVITKCLALDDLFMLIAMVIPLFLEQNNQGRPDNLPLFRQSLLHLTSLCRFRLMLVWENLSSCCLQARSKVTRRYVKLKLTSVIRLFDC